MKLTEIDILVNDQYFLYIPADGIDLVLIRNEFNLLTNDVASMRPMYITQQFELPIDRNIEIFAELKNKEKVFQLMYNRITLMTGSIVDYSTDEQKRIMLVSISSRFKDMIDFLGNNILYLDVIDLYDYNMYVPTNWTANDSNDLIKWGYYNPMNTDTGQLVKDVDNIRQYCKPSLHILTYLRLCFGKAGWTFDESNIPNEWYNLVLAPTTKYQVTSFLVDFSDYESVTTPPSAGSRLDVIGRMPVNVTIEGQPSVSNTNDTITLLYPNRLHYFKIKGRVKSKDTFYVNLREIGIDTPLIQWQYIGGGEWESFAQLSDSVNTKEGLNPLYLELYNPNIDPITIEIEQLLLHDLIPIYETNQDDLLNPDEYYYSIADNIPQITPLELYRQLLVLFQMTQQTNDITKEVYYYYVNDVFSKSDPVDTNKNVFWNGYESLGDSIDGLARNNVIRYKNDNKRQKAFNINLPQLPSNNVYFESIFAHGEHNTAWNALTIPALNYKVKVVNNVSIEYLEWKDVSPMLANYVSTNDNSIGAKLTFDGLSINSLTSNYWNRILNFMSSTNLQTPAVFKLKMRVNYYDYVQNFGQNNLFLYKKNAIMVHGEYNVLDRELTAIFISIQ